jgi:hypothetical protein
MCTSPVHPIIKPHPWWVTNRIYNENPFSEESTSNPLKQGVNYGMRDSRDARKWQTGMPSWWELWREPMQIRKKRNNCIGAIRRERNLTKQMTRMGPFTRMATDINYREKKHTKRRSRPMDIVKELIRTMVTPKKKVRDADKNGKDLRMKRITPRLLQLGTGGHEELDMLIRATIAGGGMIRRVVVRSGGSTEGWGIDSISSHTESSWRAVSYEAKSIDISWRAGPGRSVCVDTWRDMLNTGRIQCECGESETSSIHTYRYLIHNWPALCLLTISGEDNLDKVNRGVTLIWGAVSSDYKMMNTGSTLDRKATEAVVGEDADEVVLETEITNKPLSGSVLRLRMVILWWDWQPTG